MLCIFQLTGSKLCFCLLNCVTSQIASGSVTVFPAYIIFVALLLPRRITHPFITSRLSLVRLCLCYLSCCLSFMFFLWIVPQVNEIYQDSSLGAHINVVLVRIMMLCSSKVRRHQPASFWNFFGWLWLYQQHFKVRKYINYEKYKNLANSTPVAVLQRLYWSISCYRNPKQSLTTVAEEVRFKVRLLKWFCSVWSLDNGLDAKEPLKLKMRKLCTLWTQKSLICLYFILYSKMVSRFLKLNYFSWQQEPFSTGHHPLHHKSVPIF